jgi:hypothetical protein
VRYTTFPRLAAARADQHPGPERTWRADRRWHEQSASARPSAGACSSDAPRDRWIACTDLTTNSPTLLRNLRRRVGERQIDVLDAIGDQVMYVIAAHHGRGFLMPAGLKLTERGK